MAAMGHEERFPSTRRSAGYGFRKETIAGVRPNGRDAPNTNTDTPRLERASFELLRMIRLRRRDQQGSTHIPSGRSASSTDAFPRKADRFLTRFVVSMASQCPCRYVG